MLDREELKAIMAPQTADEIAMAMQNWLSPYFKSTMDMLLARFIEQVIILRMLQDAVNVNIKLEEEKKNALAETAWIEQEKAKETEQLLEALKERQSVEQLAIRDAQTPLSKAVNELTWLENELAEKEEAVETILTKRQDNFAGSLQTLLENDKEKLIIYGPNGQPLNTSPEDVVTLVTKAYAEASSHALPALKMYMVSLASKESEKALEDRLSAEATFKTDTAFSAVPEAPIPPPVFAPPIEVILKKVEVLAQLKAFESLLANRESKFSQQGVTVSGQKEEVPLNPIIESIMANRGKRNILDKFPSQTISADDLTAGQAYIHSLNKITEKRIEVLDLKAELSKEKSITFRPGNGRSES